MHDMGLFFPTLKGNNSGRRYNFRIKVGNLQMVYKVGLINTKIAYPSGAPDISSGFK
jgi:hypothetical protein